VRYFVRRRVPINISPDVDYNLAFSFTKFNKVIIDIKVRQYIKKMADSSLLYVYFEVFKEFAMIRLLILRELYRGGYRPDFSYAPPGKPKLKYIIDKNTGIHILPLHPEMMVNILMRMYGFNVKVVRVSSSSSSSSSSSTKRNNTDNGSVDEESSTNSNKR